MSGTKKHYILQLSPWAQRDFCDLVASHLPSDWKVKFMELDHGASLGVGIILPSGHRHAVVINSVIELAADPERAALNFAAPLRVWGEVKLECLAAMGDACSAAPISC